MADIDRSAWLEIINENTSDLTDEELALVAWITAARRLYG